MFRTFSLFLTILFFVCLGSCTGGGAKVGLEAPPLTLKRLGGGEMDLAGLRGKVVIVNYWSTWCVPCREEMPAFEKLYRKMEGKPFELLAVSVDDIEKPVTKMVREMNLSFPILRDPGGKTARAWGTAIYPETFLIGPDGVVVDKIIGAKDWASEKMINKLKKLMPLSK